jgi:2-polyprenyl-3-methyl-5-hydroxy-6-metoxy-1,4-benzoquinol methylase
LTTHRQAYLADHGDFHFAIDWEQSDDPERFYQHRRYRNVSLHYKAVNLSNDARILDVGCGPGILWRDYISCEQEAQPAPVGVDLSRTNLKTFKSVGSPVLADVDLLPFQEALFDLILCVDLIEHLASPDGMLVELARVARTGGYLLVSTPNARSVFEHKAVFNIGKRPSRTAIADLLGARWLRGVPSPSYPPHVKLYTSSSLRACLGQYGFRPVRGAATGFALPGFGFLDRHTSLYRNGVAQDFLENMESLLPSLCWNITMLFRKE